MSDKKQPFSAEKVKSEAHGKWTQVFQKLASQELGPAMKHIGSHVACPVHGGDDGFRLFPDVQKTGGGISNQGGPKPDGFALLMWLFNWDFPTTVEQVAMALGLTHAEIAKKPYRKPVQEPVLTHEESLKRKAELEKVWKESIPISDPRAKPALAYLIRRRLGLAWYNFYGSKSVRFHPSLPFYDKIQRKVIGNFPAIVSLVLGKDGKPVTIHRTYLTEDGQALRKQFQQNKKFKDKKIMAYRKDKQLINGGAIRLGEAEETLGVAEGIETAGSASLLFGLPVWSCLNATLLELFEIPKSVKMLIVFADKDRNEAGFKAAKELQQKAWEQGIKCKIEMPPMTIPECAKGVDWNDYWVQGQRPLSMSVGQEEDNVVSMTR